MPTTASKGPRRREKKMLSPKRRKKRPVDILIMVLLTVGGLVVSIPFLWMLSTSLDKSAVIAAPFPPRFYPLELSLYPYRVAFTNVNLLLYIKNSLFIAGGTILFSVSSALLSGYALSKIRFKGHRAVFIVILSVMMIPFESTMVSKYLLVNKLGLLNSYWALFLPSIAYPFGTFLAKQFFDTLPNTLREAAKIDGAGEASIFFQIYLPLCGATVATLIILQFLASWNDLLWPLLTLNNIKKYNIQIGMSMFTMEKGVQPLPAVMMAVTTVSVLPVLVIYLFLQRYVVEGIAMQGIKQ